jgi:protein TonB
MWIERLNAQRHNVSSSVSLAVVGVIWLLTQSLSLAPHGAMQEPMELSLVMPEIAPIVPAQTMPIALPKLNATPPEKLTPKPTPTPEVKPSVTAISPTVAAATAEPVKSEAPKLAQPVVASPVSPVPIAEPIKPTPPPSSASIESSYVATVRAQLNANKRYPTGREASLQRPSGKAVVWFVLNRNGSLNDAGIEDSSNSIILDNAALSTVRRTPYATWPEGSWPGQAQHRFTVTLDFVPVN